MSESKNRAKGPTFWASGRKFLQGQMPGHYNTPLPSGALETLPLYRRRESACF
jgi:hypothetical protein